MLSAGTYGPPHQRSRTTPTTPRPGPQRLHTPRQRLTPTEAPHQSASAPTPDDTPEPRRTKRGTAYEAAPKQRRQQPDRPDARRPAPQVHEQLQRTRGRRATEGASGPRRSDSLAPNSDTRRALGGGHESDTASEPTPATRKPTERGSCHVRPLPTALLCEARTVTASSAVDEASVGRCERCGGLRSQRRAVSRETSSPGTANLADGDAPGADTSALRQDGPQRGNHQPITPHRQQLNQRASRAWHVLPPTRPRPTRPPPLLQRRRLPARLPLHSPPPRCTAGAINRTRLLGSGRRALARSFRLAHP